MMMKLGTKSGINRRNFLKVVGVGAAVVSLPAFASGCLSDRRLLKPDPATAGGLHGTYFDQFGLDTGLIRRILTTALSRGGDFSEIFLEHSISHRLGMRDNAINRASTDIELGAGIRVLKGDATGYAYTEDLTEAALVATAQTAASIADATPQARLQTLSAVKVANHYPVEVPWSQVGLEKKLPVIERVNRLVRARDARIIKVTIYLDDQSSHILVANSDGVLAEDDRPLTSISASCVASHKGRIETGYHRASARDGLNYLGEELCDNLARRAADNTTALFESVEPPMGVLPVVLGAGNGGILLHEAMGHGFEADINRNGGSIYADMMGKRVASENVTIIDDGTLRHVRGSINVDDEGTPGQRTVLVDRGVLRSYLHDRLSAQFYKVASTGSARRESFRYPPIPRMCNTLMLAGRHPPEEIIASVELGIYTQQFANGEVATGGGDFTFFLKLGRLIEKGKLTHVIKDVNLIGSGPKVLEQMEMVGSDLAMEAHGGTCGKEGQSVPVSDGMPTVRIGGVSIGGRAS